MVDVEIKRRVRRGAEGRRVFVQPVLLILSSPTRRKSAGKTRPYGKRRHHLVAAKSRAKLSLHFRPRYLPWVSRRLPNRLAAGQAHSQPPPACNSRHTQGFRLLRTRLARTTDILVRRNELGDGQGCPSYFGCGRRPGCESPYPRRGFTPAAGCE